MHLHSKKEKIIEYMLCINVTKKKKNEGYDPSTTGGDLERPDNGYDPSTREGDTLFPLSHMGNPRWQWPRYELITIPRGIRSTRVDQVIRL